MLNEVLVVEAAGQVLQIKFGTLVALLAAIGVIACVFGPGWVRRPKQRPLQLRKDPTFSIANDSVAEPAPLTASGYEAPETTITVSGSMPSRDSQRRAAQPALLETAGSPITTAILLAICLALFAALRSLGTGSAPAPDLSAGRSMPSASHMVLQTPAPPSPLPVPTDLASSLCDAFVNPLQAAIHMHQSGAPASVLDALADNAIHSDRRLYYALREAVSRARSDPVGMERSLRNGSWRDQCARQVRGQ